MKHPKSGRFQPFLPGLSADCCVYSNDGKWIAYVTYPERDLWRSRADGSQRQQLTWPPMIKKPTISSIRHGLSLNNF